MKTKNTQGKTYIFLSPRSREILLRRLKEAAKQEKTIQSSAFANEPRTTGGGGHE